MGFKNFRDQMNTIRAQVQQQSAMLGSQNIAEVLQNNPDSWMIESCSLEAGYDPNMKTSADVRICFFDPLVASSFMQACRNSVQSAVYRANLLYYTSSPVMQQEPEPEDKELNPGQHYVKDFGDD